MSYAATNQKVRMPLALPRVIRPRLLIWFARHQRHLPYRSRRASYRIWIAELMLQQSRMDQAIPYYERLMQTFPNVRAVAFASQRQVLKVWKGFGSYARARNLHRATKIIVEQFNGRWPATSAERRSLLGNGEYIAAAIASLACGENVPVVDGNVTQVLARLLGFTGDPRSISGRILLRQAMASLLPRDKAGSFNERMMELGALWCRPQNPQCSVCPLRRCCVAFR